MFSDDFRRREFAGIDRAATAGTNAAAIRSIGRSEASSREYKSVRNRCRQRNLSAQVADAPAAL